MFVLVLYKMWVNDLYLFRLDYNDQYLYINLYTKFNCPQIYLLSTISIFNLI